MATQAEIKKYLYDTFSNYMLTENPLADDSAKVQIDKYAVMLSESIGNSIGSMGGDTPILADYVKKSGGIDAIMLGLLTANNKFKAGDNNTTALDIYYDAALKLNKIDLIGLINFVSDSIHLNGKRFVNSSNTELSINGYGDFTDGVNFGNSIVKILNKLEVGSAGLVVSDSIFSYKGNKIYHAGNINLPSVDLVMLNADIRGTLDVAGVSTFKASIGALYGASLGYNGDSKLSTNSDGVIVNGNIKMLPSSSIVVDDIGVLNFNNGNTTIRGSSGDLFLNGESSGKIRLMTSLCNENGTRELISSSGNAVFNWGLSGGIDGVQTMSAVNRGGSRGVNFNNFIEIGNASIKASSSAKNKLDFTIDSISLSMQDQEQSQMFVTDGINFIFNRPLYSSTTIGVLGSFTRLEDERVYVGNNSSGEGHYFQNMPDGMKMYGHLYMTGNLSTLEFSSGFGGYGSRLDTYRNEFTCDYITARKKFRVYEFEVSKISSVNGSLWVSSNCSGDSVVEL